MGFFAGGNDIEVEGTWVWNPSGEEISYSNWGPGEPQNSIWNDQT